MNAESKNLYEDVRSDVTPSGDSYQLFGMDADNEAERVSVQQKKKTAILVCVHLWGCSVYCEWSS